MRICLFEDAGVGNLQPLTLTRPAFDLRCGAATLLERQRRHFAMCEAGALVRNELADLCRLTYPDLVVNDPDWLRREAVILVNARWLPPAPPAGALDKSEAGMVGEEAAYVVLPASCARALAVDQLSQGLAEWRRSLPQRPAGGRLIRYPWDLIEHQAEALEEDYQHWRTTKAVPPSWLTILGRAERCLVMPTVNVEPMVCIDTTRGPVLIDEGAVVQAFSRIEGPCYLGPGSQSLGARIRGSSIGPQCRIGGEVECSIVHGHSNKAHDGFLGHSYLGEWVNLGAGTQTSDLRTDYDLVRMTLRGQTINTGLLKVGSFIGDHTKTSINTLFNTGTLVGPFTQLLTSGALLPRVVPSFCQFGHGRLRERSDLRQMITTATTAMARRGRKWTRTHSEFFFALFEQTAGERRQVLREADQWRLRRVV